MSKQHYDTLLAIVKEQEDIRRFVNCDDDGIYLTEEIINAIIWVVNHPLELMLFKGVE